MAELSSSVPPARAGARSPLFVIAVVALVVVVLASAVRIQWASTIPDRVPDQQTVVVGQDQMVPGSSSGLRLVVRQGTSGRAIQDAAVQVTLRSPGSPDKVLYTGRSDTLGTADVRFAVPQDLPASAELVVDTSSEIGADHIVLPVKAIDPARLFLTTDKPVYQPGQIIHMRALALSAVDLKPVAGAAVQWLVEDPKGNKVFRQTVDASDYGIASADFTLADEVNQGHYKISAQLGAAQSDKTVTVKWYVLPKFRVELTTEHTFYLPGEEIRGHVQADYFFGKPVSGAEVHVTGATYDVERHQVAEVRGTADANGGFDFTLEAPAYLVGTAKETADFTLEASVQDQAGQAEQVTQDLTVARQALLLEAVPESGQLRPGIENILYILTSYPDGSPAEATVQVTFAGKRQEVTSGEYGVAELRIQPGQGQKAIQISARDANGRTGAKSLDLEASTGADQVLLRPDRPTYRVGETMHLEAFAAGRTRTVYLDIVKERQTCLMQAHDLQNGRASFDVEVTADLVGTLELNAYHVQADGSLVQDTRVVVVNAPVDIQVSMTADKETYRPGDVARLAFQLSRQGQPVQGALGLSIVDESVFSVEEQDPGFARTVFLLEAELLKPRYQIKDMVQPLLSEPQPGQPVTPPNPQQVASAQAALAAAPALEFALRINSLAEKLAQALKQKVGELSQLGSLLLLLLAGLPLALMRVVYVWLERRDLLDKVGERFMNTMLVLFLGSIIILPLAGYIVYRLYVELGFAAAVLFALAWLACLAALGLDAARRRDEPVQFVAVLLLFWAVIYALLVYATVKGGVADPSLVFFMVVGGLIGLAGVYLLSLGLGQQGTQPAAFAANLLAVLTIPTLALLTTTPSLAVSPLASLLDLRAACTSPVGLLTGCAAKMRAPMATPVPQQAPKDERTGVVAAAALEAPRLRQYFPETLYWNPEAITDEAGRVSLEVPLADSITTWRLSAQSSTAQGELGGLTAGLRVFQDFFIDLDLPVALTQNDEVAVPVSVFNYLAEGQTVRLELAQESWFDLLDEPSKTLDIGPNDVTGVYFRIRAREFGRQKLTVTAWGERMSDAIARDVRVVPDGKQMLKTASGWLHDGTSGVVRIPENAIPGTVKLTVKMYPGLFSQVVEGLDALLRLPYG